MLVYVRGIYSVSFEVLHVVERGRERMILEGLLHPTPV